MADTGVLGLEVVVGEPGLLDFAESELDGGIVDIGEFLEGERGGQCALLSSG
jgi:hypothetical protein